MIIFIVTSGSYSDYHIDKVCSTEDKAKDYILSQTDQDDSTEERVKEYNVEVFEVDEKYVTLKYVTIYSVELFLSTGNLDNKWSYRTSTSLKFRGEWSIFNNCSDYGKVRGDSLVSMEHALKVAAEGRQYWLRDNTYAACYVEAKVEP